MSQSNDIIFSDDENEEFEVTWEQVQTYRIPFGQHRDKTFGDMIKRGKTRSYLRWLMTWDELRDNTRTHIECALEHYNMLKDAASPPHKLPTLKRCKTKRGIEALTPSDGEDTDTSHRRKKKTRTIKII